MDTMGAVHVLLVMLMEPGVVRRPGQYYQLLYYDYCLGSLAIIMSVIRGITELIEGQTCTVCLGSGGK